MEPVVGVLALQGAFAKHIETLKQLGAKTLEVRKPHELLKCDALIIPGGESTTMMKQMKFIDMYEALKTFGAQKPIFGTCAGLILISREIISDTMQPLNFIDVTVARNAFGRQADSFHTDITLILPETKPQPFTAFFIRAPRIRTVGFDVKVLASYEDEPVIVQQGKHLGATFHPELTQNPAIHAHFLRMI